MATFPFEFSQVAREIVVTHLGNGQNDADNLYAAYVASVSSGWPVRLLNGTYTWGTAYQLPATPGPLTIIGSPGTVINSTLTADGTEMNAPFNFVPTTTSTLGTLSAAGAVPGSRTVVSKSATTGTDLAVGKYIRIQAPSPTLRLATYKIVANNTGTKTLTLDRPLIKSFPEDSTIVGLQPLVGLRIHGNGMRITGTGDRGIEIVSGWDCYISYVTIDGQFQDFVCGYDLGCYEVTFERIRVNCNGYGLSSGVHSNVGYACVTFENSEKCTLRDAWLTGARGQAAVLLLGSDDVLVENVHTTDSDQGLLISVHEATNSVGPVGTRIVNSTFRTSLGSGVLIRDGADAVHLENVECSDNVDAGVLVTITGGLTSVVPTRVTCRNIVARRNVQALRQDCASTNTRVDSLLAVDNTDSEVLVTGGTVLLGSPNLQDAVLTSSKPMVRVGGGGQLRISGEAQIVCTTSTNMQLMQVDTGSKLYLDGALHMSKTSSGVLLQITNTSEVWINGSLHTTGSAIYGILMDDSKVHHNHPDIDWSGAATAPFFIASGTPTIDGVCGPGRSVVAMTAADKVLTWLQSQARTLHFTGSSLGSTRTVTIQPVAREQTFKNATDQSLTFVGPTGTGVTVTASSTKRLIHDGTNFIDCG